MTEASERKSILITGCSSGIGYDAAHTLAERGWQVFAACRKGKDCLRLKDEGLDTVRLDYEDEASIETAVQQVAEATGERLDAVFNNGAYAVPGLVEDISRDALRAIFEANVFGWHDLSRRVIPLMRTNGNGRIVQCSSVLGLVGIGWRGAYVASKFAIEGLSDVLRIELKGSGIHVVLIEPGPIATRIRENARIQFEKWVDWQRSYRADEYRLLIDRLYRAEGKPDRFELPPAAVTRKLIQALDNPNPRPRYFVTIPTYFAEFMRRVLTTRARDMMVLRG